MKKQIFLVSLLFCLSGNLISQTIFQWRGDQRRGIYPDKSLLKSWPSAGPDLLWKNENIGNGYGSPVIANDRLFITGEVDNTGYLFAFDLQGKLIWKSAYGSEWVVSYPGSRCAPTVVGDQIYLSSGLGDLICMNAQNGAIIWSIDMLKQLHGQFTMFGHAEAPLVDGNMVFLTPGGKDTNVVAMDRFTGKILWVCGGKGERPGYNSPLMIDLPGRKILVVFTAYSLLGIDAKTGELLWTDEQVNTPVAERKLGNGDTHANTVWFDNGFIYYIAGDGNGAVKLKLSEDGRSVKQVWRNGKIDNYDDGFIILDKYLYSGTSARKNLKCISTETGETLDSLRVGTGTMIFADGMLYYYSERGEVNLVKPEGQKPALISSFKITAGTKEHFSHPVIHNGVLYIRHGIALLAYDLRQK